MVSFKKLLSFIIITAIALALLVWTFGSFESHNPFFAFLVNWLIMSWVAVVGQFVTLPLLPSAYYEMKPFERSGRVYERLGVSLFKKTVRRGPLTVFSPTLRFPTEKTASTLRTLEKEMCKAETSHLVIFIMILVLVVYVLFKGWLAAACWLLLFNILFNGYPVMLQRYNRLKINDLIQRKMVPLQEIEA